jgi:hypothetical protein
MDGPIQDYEDAYHLGTRRVLVEGSDWMDGAIKTRQEEYTR